MFWRWFLRGLVLTLLTLCAVAWSGSYLRAVTVQRTFVSHRIWGGGVSCGFLALIEARDNPPTISLGFQPLRWSVSKPDLVDYRTYYRRSPYCFFGFAYTPPVPGPGLTLRHVIIPLWFPTLLSAGLLWLVWRKTRKKGPAAGFPVEPTPLATDH